MKPIASLLALFFCAGLFSACDLLAPNAPPPKPPAESVVAAIEPPAPVEQAAIAPAPEPAPAPAEPAPAPAEPAPPEPPPVKAKPGPSIEAVLNAPGYTKGARSRDGIGKYYMGREISHVMGHLGAGWLERPGREREEKPQLVVDHMGLKEDSVVADIGAGTGYFSFRMAQQVPKGRVIGVDIQQEMLDLMTKLSKEKGVTNVVPHMGKVDDPQLPEGEVDFVLFVDAYHEFDHPWEMMTGVMKGLKPGGRVILIEYRKEDPTVMIKPLHKMTQKQAIREMKAVGLKWVETKDILPQQHFMIFEKPKP